MLRVFFTFIFLCFSYSLSVAQQNCDLKIDKEGIQIYLCETLNSPYKTIKVNFIAHATLKQYAAGVLDIANYSHWQANIINAHILETKSKSELIYYCEVETPWPIMPRDLVFHLKMQQNSATKVLTVSLTQLPNYIPIKEGIVRIPEAQSLLTITPIDATTVNVSYVIHLDVGGDVPAFLANLFAAQTPWQTFKNYRERLRSGAISDSEIDFIDDF